MSVYIAAYFDRYRAIASGIKFGGWATAGLIFPRAFEAILRTYGFAGVWILSAAVCMHATPLIMLFKNPPIITFRREEKQSPLSCHLRGTTTSPSKYCFTDEKIPQKGGLPQTNQTTAMKSKDVDLKGGKDAKIDPQTIIKSIDGKHHTPYKRQRSHFKATAR
ncbi:hypothetical protein HPB48_016578 [Haemaphysalis longicornis]|uniref:Monocarboxylate transporter n=1 Tax=Haemaphysalis longicornis TaxID=44386 RepID=A0A9J6FRX7_HAELO|nr:hypothetical protein HPB48_016578 [Haemaphysalis longicornis]